MGLAGVCLALLGAAGGGTEGPPPPPLFVPVQRFTLAWTHSIEKLRWEEDYTVIAGKHGKPPVLHATAARVRGSGAGMEPPPDARLRDGWYAYTPQLRHPAELRLTRSGFTADYEWCSAATCTPLSSLLPSDGGITRLTACRQAPTTR